jgi:hypothetical protein
MVMMKMLDLHLTKTIEEHTVGEINKFAETADRFKRFKAKREERLDDINKALDAHEPKEDEVFRKYEGAVEEFADQLKQFETDTLAMRNAIDDDKGGETDSTVTKFPETGTQVKVGTG